MCTCYITPPAKCTSPGDCRAAQLLLHLAQTSVREMLNCCFAIRSMSAAALTRERRSAHLYIKARLERGADVMPQGSGLLPAADCQVSVSVVLPANVVEAFGVADEVHGL